MSNQLLIVLLPLAQAAEEGAERGYNWSWAVILLAVVLGLMVALRPAKREMTVRLPKKN